MGTCSPMASPPAPSLPLCVQITKEIQEKSEDRISKWRDKIQNRLKIKREGQREGRVSDCMARVLVIVKWWEKGYQKWEGRLYLRCGWAWLLVCARCVYVCLFHWAFVQLGVVFCIHHVSCIRTRVLYSTSLNKFPFSLFCFNLFNRSYSRTDCISILSMRNQRSRKFK